MFINKRVGVVMSSSFFGFYAHAGFISAIEEINIKPRCYSGTSAGALIAALVSSGLSIEEVEKKLSNITKKAFWDPDYVSLIKHLPFLKGWRGLLKGNLFRKLLDESLPIKYFEECNKKCCIVATDITNKNKKVFTKGSLIDAVYASSAVPGLFPPLKYKNRLLVDGGLIIKAPVLDLYNLYKPDIIIVHYIPSKSIDDKTNSVLNKALTPLQISFLSAKINRHIEYKLECEYVKSLGCEIIEVSPKTIRLNPNKLSDAKKAFNQAKKNTLKFFDNKHHQ